MPEKLKIGKRPAFPITVSRQYYAELRALVANLYALTKEILLPEIPGILADAAALRPTTDAAHTRRKRGTRRRDESYADTIQALVEKIMARHAEDYTEQEITDIVTDFAQRTDEFNFKQFKVSIGATEEFSIPVFETFFEQEFETFLVENRRLIKSMTQDYAGRVQGIVTDGVRRGALNKEIAAEIKKAAKVSDNKAKLIARDQVAKYNSTLIQLRQQSVGIQQYQWSTSLDERVRPTHEANEGRIFRWDSPSSITGHPGEDINCRCVAIPVFSFPNTEFSPDDTAAE